MVVFSKCNEVNKQYLVTRENRVCWRRVPSVIESQCPLYSCEPRWQGEVGTIVRQAEL